MSPRVVYGDIAPVHHVIRPTSMNTSVQHSPLAVSVPVAAARLGVCRATFYNLVKAGQVRTFKLRSRTLVAESELRRVIEAAHER